MHLPTRSRIASLLAAPLALSSAVNASTIWSGGAAPDTNLSNPLNWSDGILPDLSGPSILTFSTLNGTATIDTPVEVVRTVIGNSFTLAAGDGTLTYRGTSSGANSYGIQATSGSNNAVIDEPVLVRAVTTSGALGSLFLIYNNRVNADVTTLRINGGIALAPSSTAAGYTIRFGNNGGTADTRIAGPITGMTALQNSNANGAWAGDLIIAGDQAGLGSTDFSLQVTGFLTPTANARLVLGETAADDQTWRNFGLINVMNVAVGGNITIGTLTTSATLATKITGIAPTLGDAGTFRISSGTVNPTCVIGGAGTNQNNLNIAKTTAGVLTLNGTHTYLGNTTVEAGTLALGGSLASPVIVNAGATLSGEGSTTGSLTFGAGTSLLQFDPGTQTAALSAGSVSLAGATVVISPTASLTPGTDYAVLKLTGGTFSGLPSDNFTLAARGGTLSYTNGGTELTLSAGVASAATLLWTGANVSQPTFWDTGLTPNWTNSGSTDRYFAGDNVIFDDTAASTSVAIQGSSVAPSSMIFNNSTKDYTLSGGLIAGSTSLVKSGAGKLTLNTTGTSTFTGGVVVNGGALEFQSLNQLGSASTTAEVNGGIVRFVGSATTTGNLKFNVGPAGTTFDIAGNPANTVRIGGSINGSGNIVKSGTGILALGLTTDTDPMSDFTGTLTVTAGIVDIRNPFSLGNTAGGTAIQGATLLIQNFGQATGTKTFAAEPISFSGNSFMIAYNQENKLFTNQITGPITIAENAIVGISVARNSSGSLSPTLDFTGPSFTTGAGSVLRFGLRPATLPSGVLDTLQTVNVFSPITGAASVVTEGDPLSLYTLYAPSYTGDTTVLSGILSLAANNLANDASTVTIAETNARIELAFTGSETVARLFIGTTQLPAGTYGATGSGATNIDDLRFAGSGVLNVTSSPFVDLYAAWASNYSLTGDDALKQADPDRDGVDNLTEYATGGNPIFGAPANITTGRAGDFLTLTFTRIADPTLTYTVQGTNDLMGTWLPVVDLLGVNPATGSAAGSVTVSVPVAGRRFLRLLVTQ